MSARPSDTYFSPDYLAARERFRHAVARAGGRLTPLALTAAAPGGEALTIDIGWFGAEHPVRAFVHSSGVHGVEAFAGSAIQLQFLAEGISDMPDDCALLLVHVVNPYGMTWLRRVNEHGVDLNRNCLGPEEAYEHAPPGYEALDAFLNPPQLPGWDLFYVRAGWLILQHGLPRLKQAIAGGQYVNPQGLFFGGTSLEEGPRCLQRYVRDRLADVRRLIGVDVHTGLGPFGVDTLLVNAPELSQQFATLRQTFGQPVSPSDPKRSPAYQVRGTYDTIFRRALPEADVCFVVQEFGTYSNVRVLKALRAENCWHRASGDSLDHQCKTDLVEAFAPKSESWRDAVLQRGRTVTRQAQALLTSAAWTRT
jgi:hypothetical protein